MADEPEARSFGRSAGTLSVGVGLAGLLTYVYFALASHNLDATAYGEIVVLWSAAFVTISVLHRPVEQFISRTVAERPRPRGADRPDPARGGAGSRGDRARLRDRRAGPARAARGRPALRLHDPLLDLRRRRARVRGELLRPRLPRRRGPGSGCSPDCWSRSRSRGWRSRSRSRSGSLRGATRSLPGSSRRRSSRSASSRSPSAPRSTRPRARHRRDPRRARASPRPRSAAAPSPRPSS